MVIIEFTSNNQSCWVF